MMTSYSTANTQPQDRSSRWNNIISDAYFPLQTHFRDPLQFHGKLSKLGLGHVGLSRLTSEPVNYERRRRHIREAREEEYLITIPKNSSVEFRQLGKDVRCEPGGFILERGDEPYRFMYTDPNDLFVLKVSKKVLAERIRQPDRFCAKVIDATSGTANLFTSMVGHAQTQLGHASITACETLGRQLLELLSLALEEKNDASDFGASSVRAAHLNRIDQFIRASLKNPDLTPDLIAESCGISKRYLHDLFKDVNGTVSQQVRDQRLIAARDRLGIAGEITMVDLAYRFGFSDQAQFSRLFKAKFSITPSDFRAQTIG